MKKIIALFVFMAIATGCTNTPETVAENKSPKQNTSLQQCPEERPQMCTKIYQPVCATRDTGIRCVKSPCSSTETKTYGNSCTACADTKVTGYIPGECPEKKQQD